MAKTLIATSKYSSDPVAPGATVHGAFAGLGDFATLESRANTPFPVAGVWADLRVYVNANTLSNGVTIRSRKNGANGGQSIAITTETGWISCSGSDTIAAGDYGCVQLVTGAGTGSLDVRIFSSTFAATTNTVTIFTIGSYLWTGNGATAAGYQVVEGTSLATAPGSTEANTQVKLPADGYIKYLKQYLSDFSGTSITTTIRVNGSDSGISIAATGTGWFADTESQAVSAGDLINYYIVQNVSGTTRIRGASFGYETTNGQSVIATQKRAAASFSINSDYIPICGAYEGSNATRAITETSIPIAGTLKNAKAYCSSYSGTSLTVTLVKNGSNTDIVLSITGTGWTENNTNTATVAEGDLCVWDPVLNAMTAELKELQLTLEVSDVNIWTVTPTGGMSLAGAAPLATITNVTPVGGLSLAGEAIRANIINAIPEGGFQLAGTAAESKAFGFAPSGGLIFAGEVATLLIFSFVPSGGLQLAGDAVEDYVGTSGTIYDVTPTGGYQFAGIAPESRVFLFVPTGGLNLAGQALESKAFGYSPSGGFTLAGDPAFAKVFVITPDGGLLLAGDATEDYVGASGTIYDVTPTGGIIFAGDPLLSRAFGFIPSGGFSLAGVGPVSVTFGVIPTGGIQLSGAALLTKIQNFAAEGGLNLSGAAVGVYIGAGLAELFSLSLLSQLWIRLDVKKITDEGSVDAISTDTNGTAVTFAKTFRDIDSIVATVQDTTAHHVVVDFVDAPNPTGFSVYVFDAAGVRASKTVRWIARGRQ